MEGTVNCFILKVYIPTSEEPQEIFEVNDLKRFRELRDRFYEENKYSACGYFTRFLTSAGQKEEQSGVVEGTYIGQKAWRYKCSRCKTSKWLFKELPEEIIDSVLCGPCGGVLAQL